MSEASIRLLNVQISVDNPAVAAMADRLCHAVEKTVHVELGRLAMAIRATAPPPEPPKPAVGTPQGVELADDQRLRATDLRMALLLGKIPKESGILIDSKATAKLLNISYRTLFRLLDEKAMPEPVTLGSNIKKWRLAEILEWVDNDCPPQKHWTYPGSDANRKGRGR